MEGEERIPVHSNVNQRQKNAEQKCTLLLIVSGPDRGSQMLSRRWYCRGSQWGWFEFLFVSLPQLSINVKWIPVVRKSMKRCSNSKRLNNLQYNNILEEVICFSSVLQCKEFLFNWQKERCSLLSLSASLLPFYFGIIFLLFVVLLLCIANEIP